MAPKRRATSPIRPPATKKQQTSEPGAFDHSHNAEKAGIINRTFYPSEMSNERCQMYKNGDLPLPLHVLNDVIAETTDAREKIKTGECVVHWFKRDLRLRDNHALAAAGKRAEEADVPLIGMYVLSPEDLKAHCTAPARVDFVLRTLEVLREDLKERNIPLFIATVEKRKVVPGFILQKCEEWGAKHVYCNVEYEVDELRRETKLVRLGLKSGVDVTPVHSDCIVKPGELTSGSGKQYSVYSPWYRAWMRHLHEHPHLLKLSEPPSGNSEDSAASFKKLFDMPIPTAPEGKRLEPEDQKRLASFWPAGEHEAHDRLERFVSEKVSKYKDTRNLPSANSTSLLSVHLAAGTISARTAVAAAHQANSSKKLDGGNAGIVGWISEIAWRDFYKHVMAEWPYVCMAKPFKYEYSDIEWEYNDEHLAAWQEGRTGFPIVDAAMRQVRGMAYMHNRCRMIVASFLAKDLLLDWRAGEKFFMENLIDGDFASNNGGWGFSASTGVDPQPYFRIFNPLLQSEKFDPNGEYIRKWVPELADVSGKAVHDPYGRGAAKVAEKMGYPRPIVDHKASRARALERYKGGLGRSTANVGGGVHN